MARLCSVAPIHILEALADREQLGNNHLLLAHDVVQHANRYQTLFGELTARDPDALIILDNSAYELKRAVDSDMVWAAADIVAPTCVVLPDVYLDGPATLKATRDVFEAWDVQSTTWKIDLMAIPQGATPQEWVKCAEGMRHLAKECVGFWWGIPRNMREILGQSRRFGIDICHALDKDALIHLFGFSNDHVDDFLCSHLPQVTSIDTTTHIRAGSLGLPFHLLTELPSRGDWWETAEWNALIPENIKYATELFA